MNKECYNNLQEIKHLLNRMTDEQFANTLNILSNASVGQHVRHIIELYQCLFKGIENGEVNYDNRKRDKSIEISTSVAIGAIEALQKEISAIDGDKNLILLGNFSLEEIGNTTINTTLMRELAYNLEHSIHHQALIKIALNTMDASELLPMHFGIASATVRFHVSKA